MSPFELVESSEDVKEYQDRYIYIYGAIVLTFLILVLRLWFLQILKGNEFQKFSEQNQIKEDKNPAPRGMLFDRNGDILVDSLPSFNATITPQYILTMDRTAQDLANTLKIKKDDLIDRIKSSRRQNGVFKPVHIKDNLTRDEVAAVERMVIDNPGLKVDMGIKRNYLLNENGAQLFGYTAEISKDELPIVNLNRTAETRMRAGDIVGKAGLEKKWDPELRGQDGARFVEVDARGREIASGRDLILGGYPEGTDYVPGHNVTLTIDKDIQIAAYESFQRNKRIGSIVALDPHSGEILALVNAPSYNPNSFATGIPTDVWAQLVNDPFKPLRNKAVQDHFPPASTFKAIVAIAALQEKAITVNSTFTCPGYLMFGKRKYNCWQKHGHGAINVMTALEKSCDVFFYHLGINLGMDVIAKYAKKLGLGSRTGILMDNERSGLIPDSEWKKKTLGEEWQPGENLSNAIGQGFNLVTPLQMAVTYGAIGTEGLVYRPFLIKKIESLDGKIKQSFNPQLIRDAQKKDKEEDVVIDPATFKIVKEGLTRVFAGEHGTGHSFRIPGLEIAGKTGTAQLFQLSAENIFAKCENKPLKQRHNGWMVAFAPADDPKIALAVHAEHACHGTAAGPTIKDVLVSYFKKYHPELIKDVDVKVKTIAIPSEVDE